VTDYAPDEHDVDPAAIERAQQLWDRLEPLVEGSAQWRYLRETRKLPADAIRRCSTDLRALEPQVPYFGSSDRGIVSIIRNADGTAIGFAVEACGVAGEAVKRNGRTLRRFFNLTETKLSAGLFRAVVDAKGGKAVMAEGHLAKCIAAAALFPDRSVYGFGSMPWLGRAVPPEDEVLVLEDQEPPE
jgi:hypothetical protein